jgi:hypothetical protein
MTDKQPTERQRRKWREDRARLRLMAKHFPAPLKVQLTPEEKRERKNAAAREARATRSLGEIDLTCPLFHVDGRIIRSKPARKRPKVPEKRASGPWDSICLPPT